MNVFNQRPFGQSQKKHAASKGFTLIELLIVIAIIGIFMAVALPAYRAYVVSANRDIGSAVVLTLAQAQAEFSTQVNGGRYAANMGELNFALQSGADLYTLTTAYIGGDDETYTITAEPNGWEDDECGNLILTHTGIRLIDTNQDGQPENDADLIAECWSQ